MMLARPMTASDRRYVASTWAHGMRYGWRLSRRFDAVDHLLDGPARVTCLATDERTVHAWMARAGDVLLFVYVPPELRRRGFAKRLLDGWEPRVAAHPLPRWFLPRCHYRPLALAELLAMETAA